MSIKAAKNTKKADIYNPKLINFVKLFLIYLKFFKIKKQIAK